MTSRLRIAFVSSGLGVGGAEHSLLALVRHLDPARFDPFVLSLGDVGPVGAQIQALGVPVEAAGIRGLGTAWPGIGRLTDKLRGFGPDIVQTWMYHADLLGSIAARRAGVRHVFWGLRNTTLPVGVAKTSTILVARLCARLSHRWPEAIVSCSAEAARVHRSMGYDADRFMVIPNGFDLEAFRADDDARRCVRDELGIADPAPLVAMVGRWDPQKNHLGLVEAVASLGERASGVHFVLAGLGVDASNLQLRAALGRLPPGCRFHLLGLRQDVPRLLAAADWLVLPSIGEAFPRVVCEAMACETPCIVTDVGDAAQIVADTGRVVAPADPDALAQGLAWALEQSPGNRSRLGALARRRVGQEYDIRQVADRYMSLYSRVATPGPRADGRMP